MAKITRKLNLPAISLVDLLRKRKMTLEKFVNEFGLASFESLKIRCERMGVAPPSEELYNSVKSTVVVNSPPDGILVMEAPKFIAENSGKELTFVELDEPLQEIEPEDLNKVPPEDKLAKRNKNKNSQEPKTLHVVTIDSAKDETKDW